MRHQYFSFARAAFVETVAHAGCGRIRTTRVIDAAHRSGFRFIDLTELPPGTSVGVHQHAADDEEVYVIVQGRGRMLLDGETFDVGPGDVIRNVPGGTHGLMNTGSEPLTMVVLDVASNSNS
jgi:mannose-6-phosphate isomerase-like protein (cupin superfamily)